MRNRMERFVLLPLSLGCISESSIAVGGQFQRRPTRNTGASLTRIQEDDKEEDKSEDDDESLSEGNLKNLSSLLPVPKFQSLLKNFKNLSQLFVYKDEEIEEDDMGMDIGLPTDVKHVTHIGIDGYATSILSRRWDNRKEHQSQAPAPLPVHLTPSKNAVAHEGDELNLRHPSENAHDEDLNTCNQYYRQSLRRAMEGENINSNYSASENY